MGQEPFQTPIAPLIRLDRVTLKGTIAAQLPILQDLSFSVQAGDRLALVGASGSGKTSLLRLLNRLSDATSGTIYWQGQDIRQVPVVTLRQQIPLVLQESKLLGMTVQDAIAYPLQLRGLQSREIQQRLDTWIDRLQIPLDWLDRTELQLSLGQRQWVAIARALVLEPKVLLLDEPTSALDAGRAEQLMQLLITLAKERSLTILMANHQLSLARAFSSRVIHLQAGQLIQDLPTNQMDWTGLQQVFNDLTTQPDDVW